MSLWNIYAISLLIVVALLGSELSNANSVSLSEWSTLKDIFNTTIGLYWKWKSIADGNHWNFTNYEYNDPCNGRWQGVNCTCSLPADNCTVTGLALGHYNLTGYLPNRVGNLTNIKFLNLSGNSIGGKPFSFVFLV